jgi:RNA polymerase sigma-70 factor (ECF subfamily)
MDIENRVLLAKNGDKEMFTALIKERKEDLYRIAYMYVKNQQDALDIVSETVYKAYFSINKLRNLKYFTTWLTKILINCSLDHLKKYNNTVPLHQHEDIAHKNLETSKEELIDLYDAVDKLRDVYKSVIILKYFEDMTINEIGEIMDKPPHNIKNFLHKALVQLRIELKDGEKYE